MQGAALQFVRLCAWIFFFFSRFRIIVEEVWLLQPLIQLLKKTIYTSLIFLNQEGPSGINILMELP